MIEGSAQESAERRAFSRDVDWDSMYSLLSTRTSCCRLGKRSTTELGGRKGENGVQRGGAAAAADVEEALRGKGGGEVKRDV